MCHKSVYCLQINSDQSDGVQSACAQYNINKVQANTKNKQLFHLCSGDNQHLVSFLRVPATADEGTKTLAIRHVFFSPRTTFIDSLVLRQ